jgi:hypothetical protein
MAKLTVSTGALLACGVAAGPIYLAVTSAQALTRDGYDASRQTWNVLTIGDLGWIQRLNLLLVGVLTVLFAVGVRRVLGPGWGGRWASRLLVLEGVGHQIAGAVFTADPQPGFPPGTSPETTWHGIAHDVVRGGGYAFVFAASLVIAGWFAKEGRRRGWAWFALATVPGGVAGVFHEVLAGSVHPILGPIFGEVSHGNSTPSAALNVALIVLTLVPTWVWFTTFAVHLYRRVDRQDAVPGGAGPGMRIAAKAA